MRLGLIFFAAVLVGADAVITRRVSSATVAVMTSNPAEYEIGTPAHFTMQQPLAAGMVVAYRFDLQFDLPDDNVMDVEFEFSPLHDYSPGGDDYLEFSIEIVNISSLQQCAFAVEPCTEPTATYIIRMSDLNDPDYRSVMNTTLTAFRPDQLSRTFAVIMRVIATPIVPRWPVRPTVNALLTYFEGVDSSADTRLRYMTTQATLAQIGTLGNIFNLTRPTAGLIVVNDGTALAISTEYLTQSSGFMPDILSVVVSIPHSFTANPEIALAVRISIPTVFSLICIDITLIIFFAAKRKRHLRLSGECAYLQLYRHRSSPVCGCRILHLRPHELQHLCCYAIYADD